MVLDRSGWEVIPEKEFQGWGKEGIPKMEALSYGNEGISGLDLHTKNFIDAVKSRDNSILTAPLKVGYDAAVVSHMGNVAYKTGNRVYWDKEKGQFTDSSANELIKANYQNGWKLPYM